MLAHVVQHIAFEHLGNLERVLSKHGYAISTFMAGAEDLGPISEDDADLLVVLGGPIGVYETDAYPYLETELQLIRDRIARNRPVLGICLGCQLIARALGADVYPGGAKEIGWAPLEIHDDVEGNVLAPMQNAAEVLHWHGDTFDLPAGATRLASSAVYPNQAFSYRDNVLALQFHLEVEPEALESWYLGHAHEIASVEGLTVPELREDGQRYGPTLQGPAQQVWAKWLESLAAQGTVEAAA
ncbi:glutamine amidotransferase [Thiorhodococcus minor]|uniref:Glutamine amidotransferase n=1 Tax=Thiorhodococcus minor TaxID=57489 RepID=A0A6M0K7V3_9GAMM|nr:glutamine amidotransferase [Thiorhodococcus minor]NEV65033.1 glutamine amidotransferase [Thiorhodococcus minor]